MGVLCVYIIQIVNEMHQKSRHLNGKCKNCRERETERDRERQRERQRDRERQRETERDRERQRDREDLMTNNMLDMLITKFLYTCIYIGFCAI